MVDKLAVKSQRAGLKLVRFQFLLVLLLALISTVIFSAKPGYSALAGGMTYVLPNVIFVLMTFAHVGASKSNMIVKGFFAGEAIKLCLTVVLFVAFLYFTTLSLSSFYAAFAILVASQWLAPFFFQQQQRDDK
ncbi:ATP synthase subunit I [Psychromonas aquimarina]|uniref:ATP synthase subunit I n=1 Tax=Psychromonas aquimarina TaxID=444919 RepID=UPI000419B11A|nr:ATP synthase subunit I [Psychromonas aquimarina]